MHKMLKHLCEHFTFLKIRQKQSEVLVLIMSGGSSKDPPRNHQGGNNTSNNKKSTEMWGSVQRVILGVGEIE